jgi:hypothetical protein
MPTLINGKDIAQPFYVCFDCDCGNHLEIQAQPGWSIGIRGLAALRWTCLECGKVFGGEEFSLPKLVLVSEESENNT